MKLIIHTRWLLYQTIFALLTCALFTQFSVAFAEIRYPRTQSLNHSMTKIAEVMEQLFPLITDDRYSKTEIDTIKKHVQRLEKLFSGVGHDIKKKSDAYQISYTYISEYLDNILFDFEKNRIRFALGRLQNIGEICISCHTQDKQFRTIFKNQSNNNFADDMAQAEFNFITRNYLIAESFYQNALKKLDSNSTNKIQFIARRLIVIYTQVLDNINEGGVSLKKALNISISDQKVVEYLNGLIEGLTMLQEAGVSHASAISFNEIESLVTKYLGAYLTVTPVFYSTPQEEVGRVWLRGMLYHYLNTAAQKKEMPYLLYWLSLTTRSIGYNYDYVLADFYIKECMQRYSKHEFAKSCYNEYERYVTFYYTNPLETVLPIEIDRELKKYKKMVFHKKRKRLR